MTRILIADDDSQVLEVLGRILTEAGYEVVTAANGVDALEAALMAPPALIVTDVFMPVMDGFTLCRLCKADERLKQVPFIFYSGTYTDTKDRDFGLGLGAAAFLMKPEEPNAVSEMVRQVLEQHPQRPEYSVESPLGEEMEVLRQYNAVLFRQLEKKMLQLQREVAERQQAQEALLVERERLQALSRRLADAQETERRFIARELHDEIGQVLTGLKLLLETGGRASSDTAAAHMAEAQELVGQLLDRVRDLSLDLRPTMLDDLGLLPALMWLVRRFAGQTGIQVALDESGIDRPLSSDVETAAYRIVQEALTNVARHSQATEATVRMWVEGDALHVQVEDRGKGFDAGAAYARYESMGLVGMRERAVALGGELVIESVPGSGTQITAELPLAGACGSTRRA